MFEFSRKQLITNSWIFARYGDWYTAFYVKQNQLFDKENLHCYKCGLYETFPIDILGEIITVFDNGLAKYCLNCAAKLYGTKIRDCTTDLIVTVNKIDKYHILKYKIKLVLLWIWIILRFIYELLYQIIMWKIVLPIKRYFYKRQNEKVQNRANSQN